MNETKDVDNRNARKHSQRFAEASETLLANLPLLVCGLVMTVAVAHEWLL